jgi:hypothetical protein
MPPASIPSTITEGNAGDLTPRSSSEGHALLPSPPDALLALNEEGSPDAEKQESTSKTKRKYLGLTSENWCYVWLAFCVVGGIVGGTMGAVYGKGTRYGTKHS